MSREQVIGVARNLTDQLNERLKRGRPARDLDPSRSGEAHI